jgi:hypothetical protein
MAPEPHGAQVLPDPELRPKNMIRPHYPPYNFCVINFFPSLKVEAVDALQTLFRAPLTLGVHPGGQNIAYDLALVKLGPHTKFGEDWSNGVDFYTGHTHTHTDSPLYIRY